MTTTRLRAAAARFTLALPALLLPAPASAAEPSSASQLRCLEQDHSFSVADLKGSYVALHVLPADPPPAPGADAPALDEYHSRADAHAGLTHLFLTSASDADARAWWGDRPKDDRLTLVADPGGALASILGGRPLPVGATTIVLDPTGREILRATVPPSQRLMSFSEFARLLEPAWHGPAIGQYNLPKRQSLAVDGYDVVSYFTDNKAAKGLTDITSTYEGVIYRFATRQHKERFVASPRRYLPTYGGWCASAMGDGGRKVEIDPTNFKVKDGRLFLFYKSFFADALKDWNKNEKTWEPAADEHWKNFSGESPIRPAGAP